MTGTAVRIPLSQYALVLQAAVLFSKNNICGMQGFAVQPNVEATCNMGAYTYKNHGTGYKYTRGGIKMSPGSLYLCEIQTNAII